MDVYQMFQERLKPGLFEKYNLRASLYNWFLLSIPSIGFFGCQISWSLQNGFATPQLQLLGLSDYYISYVWLAGPITGIVIQPLIGIWSDSMQNTNNRRRPFILFGTILLVLSLLLFSNSIHFSKYGLSFGIIAFCLQDISVNMVQAPLRALISDIIPTQHHSASNSLFGLFNGIGCSIAYGLGALLSYNQDLGGGISILYAFGAVIIIIATVITLRWSTNEQILDIDSSRLSLWNSVSVSTVSEMTQTNSDTFSEDCDELMPLIMSDHQTVSNTVFNGEQCAFGNEMDIQTSKCEIIMEAIYCMPTPIFRAFIVQFLVHYSHCCIGMYLTDWFGKNIMFGDPMSEESETVRLYEKGVKYATIGLFLMSLLSIPISVFIPKLCNTFGAKLVWFTSCLVYCLVMINLALLPTLTDSNIVFAKKEIGIALIACLSFPLAASKIIGWTIVTKTLCLDPKNNDKRALYTTIFNLANASPGIIVSLVSGSIILAANHNVSSMLIMGSMAAFMAAMCCCFVIDVENYKFETIK